MAKRKFLLSPAEVADLADVLKSVTGNPAFDRLRAILAYSAGAPWSELSARYRCSRSSLHHWCSTYRRVGKAALISRDRRGGRASHLTKYQLAELAQRLTTTTPAQAFPGSETFGGDCWTAKDLYRAIRLWYGVVYNSPTTYYTLLKRMPRVDSQSSDED